MTLATVEAIRAAIEVLQKTPDVNKLEGTGWKVYRVGTIIRIDVEEKR